MITYLPQQEIWGNSITLSRSRLFFPQISTLLLPLSFFSQPLPSSQKDSQSCMHLLKTMNIQQQKKEGLFIKTSSQNEEWLFQKSLIYLSLPLIQQIGSLAYTQPIIAKENSDLDQSRCIHGRWKSELSFPLSTNSKSMFLHWKNFVALITLYYSEYSFDLQSYDLNLLCGTKKKRQT